MAHVGSGRRDSTGTWGERLRGKKKLFSTSVKEALKLGLREGKRSRTEEAIKLLGGKRGASGKEKKRVRDSLLRPKVKKHQLFWVSMKKFEGGKESGEGGENGIKETLGGKTRGRIRSARASEKGD